MACRKCYIKGEKINAEEDLLHEFKGHRSFAAEEVPKIAITNRTRRPISRNFCGFLNTGLGGIVYCGVLDSGEVAGINLTAFQQDHILLSLQDLFSRFTPSVTPDMYVCRFIPVLRSLDELELAESVAQAYHDGDRNKPHTMRKSVYCWCDKDAEAQFEMGRIAQSYVIEVEILPWNPESELAVTEKTRIHPLFSNEEGLYFIRRLAGLHQPTLKEVIELTEAETVRYHCQNK